MSNLLTNHSAIISALIAVTGVIVVGLLTWRSNVRKSNLDELREMFFCERDRREKLEKRLKILEQYTYTLQQHIYNGEPPPPPPPPPFIIEGD